MYQVLARVTDNKKIAENIHLLEFEAPVIAGVIKPGQFLNLRVNDNLFPLLRRPFSICEVKGDRISVMFNVTGEGTKILAQKKQSDVVDILGPLGKGFTLNFEEKTVIIIAGGLGAAPFPYLTKELQNSGKEIFTVIGGRSSRDIIKYGLTNLYIVTEDGSEGMRGNVIDCYNNTLSNILSGTKFRVLTCGPNGMLRALKNYFSQEGMIIEASVESAMACGFGICQGCPIEHAESPDAYKLICKDGPVFNLHEITI
ncbi:MAG: dihydroorotate dehydrogenase B (NAD(+)), electron transfer subunit [Ignavibacteriales bacterium]